MIHIFKSISATLKIQKWLCKSRHILLPTSGGLSEKKIAASKNKKYNKSWKRAKTFTEDLLIYKEWNREVTDSRDYRHEPFRTNQLSTKRLSLEERHCVQPQVWKRGSKDGRYYGKAALCVSMKKGIVYAQCFPGHSTTKVINPPNALSKRRV